MNCKCCNKEINETNSINELCSECDSKIIEKMKELETNQKIEALAKEKLNTLKSTSTIETEKRKNNNLLPTLIISLTIILTTLFGLAFALAPLYSPSSQLSKKEYIEKCQSITYKELARNPISHKGNDYTIQGRVMQIQENYGNDIQLLIYITENSTSSIESYYYENLIYVTYEYNSDIENKIIEGDMITIFGKCQGSKTYTTVLGSSNTIPYINALYIEIN